MPKYRKKPVEIEAEQYTPGLEDGFDDAVPSYVDYCKLENGPSGPYPYIETLEGKHYIGKGDFIITGVQGERYPCKPDIFAETYEAI
jgi:hypothetical protein